MKRTLTIVIALLLVQADLVAQPVKGFIYADTAGVQVVKVWGTHQERGYALGYLTGTKITDVIVNYLKPEFGVFYPMARNIIIQGNDLEIDVVYKAEAQAVVDGMNASGTNPSNLDQTDILVGNTFLEITNLLMMQSGMNCSELMSWGDATAGTDLDGKPVIARHLDWEYSTVLSRNNVIVVHFPSETEEQKWLLIGFSGMFSALSGFNQEFGAFQNMMDDNYTQGTNGKHYIPIWFALRRAMEAADYNGDGARNVQDVRSSLQDCTMGFADGFIISALGQSAGYDSLVAMVAELAPGAPTHTYRYSNYPDSIPGDNLYTANYQIARNNAMHFCSRYNGIRNHIGDGTLIGLDTNWNLMRDWSHLPANLQFMQYAPESDFMRISVYRNSKPAWQNDPVVFTLTELFDDPTVGTGDSPELPRVWCIPNPASGSIRLMTDAAAGSRFGVDITDPTGRSLLHRDGYLTGESIDVSALRPGLYLVRLTTGTGTTFLRLIKA